MNNPTERGLFERIKDQIDMHHCCNFPQAIEKICADYEQQLAAAREEVEGLKTDALRYRWLRNEISIDASGGTRGALVELASDKYYDVPEELDAAIDAAMITAPLPEKNES